ncbi:MAG: hypothetical protein Ct9H90mP13_07430 [Pseudomonadota bacterium]|nr:MAG: hypothetical protein Ct9H90mP13_07430 [Pseudomonadota bacterium]
MRTIHHINRESPFDIANIADLGDVSFSEPFDHQAVKMTSQISLVW